MTLKRVLKLGLSVATFLVPLALCAQTNSPAEAAINPYGFQAMWEGGDWVSKAALMTLLA